MPKPLLAELEAIITELKDTVGFETPTQLAPKDEAIFKHSQAIIEQLEALNPKELVASLETFFEKNWQLTQNTMLAYTASADAPVNQALLKLAIAVVAEKNLSETESFTHIIQLLMPLIHFDELVNLKDSHIKLDENQTDISFSPDIDSLTYFFKNFK